MSQQVIFKYMLKLLIHSFAITIKRKDDKRLKKSYETGPTIYSVFKGPPRRGLPRIKTRENRYMHLHWNLKERKKELNIDLHSCEGMPYRCATAHIKSSMKFGTATLQIEMDYGNDFGLFLCFCYTYSSVICLEVTKFILVFIEILIPDSI